MIKNRNVFLSLGALAIVSGCLAGTQIKIDEELLRRDENPVSIDQQARKFLHEKLNRSIDREEFGFHPNGNNGTKEYFATFTRSEFEGFLYHVEYAVCGVVVQVDQEDPEVRYITFTGDVGFERNKHWCGIKKAGWVDKLKLFVSTKDYKVFLQDMWIRVSDDSYTHVAFASDIKRIKEFGVAGKQTEYYPNMPMTSKIGNKPGVRTRVDGKTSKKGKLVGISYVATKTTTSAADEAKQPTYIFGEVYKEVK